MAMVASPNIGKPPPPPPPPPPPLPTHGSKQAPYSPYTGTSVADTDGMVLVLVLRAAAALLAFVAVALVASCRHGGWMQFARYQEYRYLLGVTVVAAVYSALQALRTFRRRRATFLDFAGDQVVAYLLITASSAALPITIRMRSAVVNIFTDAIAASISLAFLAFAALAVSAMLAGFRLSAAYN